jgi:hypothetical protein
MSVGLDRSAEDGASAGVKRPAGFRNSLLKLTAPHRTNAADNQKLART